MPLPDLRRALRGLLLIVLMAFGASLRAEPANEGRMTFRPFGPQDGLTTSTAWALLADQAGFLWVGSEDGLYRYDGNRFKAYGRKEGLPSHFIWSLHQGPDGTLWVGTFKGLARLRDDHFETVALGPDGFAPEVSAIRTGPGGRIWVATSGGAFRQGEDGAFAPVPGWPGGAATALWTAPGARVWAASWSNAMARVWRWEHGAWHETQGPKAMAGAKLDALAVDGGQRVWARSLRTLWQLNPGDRAFHSVSPALPATQQRGCLYVDRAGSLWVATVRGLAHFSQDGAHWVTPADGLPNASLAALTEDRQGTLWVAGAGVYQQLGGGAWRSYAQGAGLPSRAVWVIFRDRDGTLFAGTDAGLFREGPGRWTLVPGTAGVQVRTIVQAPDKTLYLAGSPEILRWGPRKGAFTRFGPKDGVVTGGRIYRLLLDRDGALWVATDKGGLLRGTARGAGMVFHREEALPQGSPTEDVLDLCLDGAGRLWASGAQGLLVLDRGAWHRFTTRDGLRNDHVSFLHATPDGHIVFAYFEAMGLGLAAYGPGGFQLLKHLDDTAAPDKVIYLLGEDARGRFWVGTGQGLDRSTPSGAVEHFGLEDGLITEDTNSQAFLAEPNGDVWIGTSFGLERFRAGRDLGWPKPPACVILACRLGGAAQPVFGGADRSAPGRNSTFEADFAGLSFVKGSQINYQTRLDGLEADWRATGTREVRYSSLAPGSYCFEVRARIGRGDWSEPATLSFRVLPAWWQTWWVKLLEAFAVAGIGALLAWWRMASLHRRNRLLEDMVAERTLELASANEQLKNQSLTDPLTGLKNRRFLGLCMPDDVAQLNRVHHTALKQGDARLAVNIDMIFIMVDLDHFKDVNDRYGHAAGDLVLQEVAQLLRLATRDSDTIVRWGGEEFLVVARNAAREDAITLMERIRQHVADHVFRLEDGREIHCTCSLGFTFYPFVHGQPELLPWERLLDLADHCLYAAKRGGRNAWVGLYPAADADMALLKARIPAGIGELIWRHQIEARTSLPEDVILEWDGNA